jgi:hypothetical protein
MEHEPSDYEGTVTLSFYQMVEVHKALSERIATLLRRGEYEYREKDIDALLAVAEILGDHEQKAVEGWERKVAEREASALNDDEAVRRFLDGQ